MLSNKRQCTITKSRIDEFAKAIAILENNGDSPDDNQQLRQKAHLDALNSQLAELRSEIAEYEQRMPS